MKAIHSYSNRVSFFLFEEKDLFSKRQVRDNQYNFLHNLLSYNARNPSTRIEEAIITVAHKPQQLYDALQNNHINRILTRLIQGRNSDESSEKYLLKEWISSRVKSVHIAKQPEEGKVDALLTRAYQLARMQVDELGLFSSTNLKLSKVDLLCGLIPILHNHKYENIQEGKIRIMNDLSSFVINQFGEESFKQALKGKRVKALILETTGENNVDALMTKLKAIHAAKRNEISIKIDQMANTMSNVNHLITENKKDETIRLMTDANMNLLELANISINPSYPMDQRAQCAKVCETYASCFFAATKQSATLPLLSYTQGDGKYDTALQYRLLVGDLIDRLPNDKRTPHMIEFFERCDRNIQEVRAALSDVKPNKAMRR